MSKILVTGGSGLVGSALKAISNSYPNFDFIFLSSKDCNLLCYEEVLKTFSFHSPDIIIHLAAQVGGLFKNMNHKVVMFEDNILINLNVLKAAHNCNIQKVVSCLSTCIFPDKTTYPINEEMLHNGPPHHSNDAYAYAKRMLEIQSIAYQENFDRDYICVIPTNIYGPNDNYNLKDAHVIPALIHQCYLSKKENRDFVVKGSGKPLRQFIYSEDLAELIMWIIINYKERKSIILSVDEKDEVSIGYVAKLIADQFEYSERIVFDSNFSDGQFKKTADNTLLRSYIPNHQFISIEEGIKKSVEWFRNNYPNLRK